MNRSVRGLIAVLLVWGMAAVVPASGSAASPPPTAVTGAAAQITAATAVLNGTVNANGQASTYVFQYGPTISYGSQTATTSAGSGTTATAEHATLSGLVSNSTYHFRIVATSPAGTTAGTDATFTTSKAPPTATTSSPSLVTSSSAVVNGTLGPNGKTTTYVVQYGPTTSYGLQTAATAAGSGTTNVAVHATLSGLRAGTTYHYRLLATNADATTPSADATLETTGTRAAPSGPLPAVSEATAVGISAHAVQLNGAINPQGPTTQWYFDFGLSANYGLQTATQTISGLRPYGLPVA
jgi:phosphodiesterase/alkaline phosphatase D-like protein